MHRFFPEMILEFAGTNANNRLNLWVVNVIIKCNIVRSCQKKKSMFIPEERWKMYKNRIKRVLDFTIAVLGLLICAIPMVMVALLIRIESPGPAIFRQQRIGKDGKVFEILKFRSMRQGAEHTGSGVYSGKGDTRVTRLGRVLRATSIDELPQLFNILRGDMSLIGPRPPLTYHPWSIEEYTDEQRRMFDVRPGITGWAQVNGRKGVEWHHRIELNVWYVDNVSFLLDMKIFFLTIYKVFKNADNENTGETVKK